MLIAFLLSGIAAIWGPLQWVQWDRAKEIHWILTNNVQKGGPFKRYIALFAPEKRDIEKKRPPHRIL